MVEPRELIDRSLKVLTRRAPHAFCRLAGIAVEPSQIRFEDTAVNMPEFRADQILLIGDEGDPARWGWHLSELAPLLVLCEDSPTEATLQRERELILGLSVSRPVQVEMLGVAMMVGTRFFARDLL